VDKPIPDLSIDDTMADYEQFLDIDTKQIPAIANNLAAVLVAGNFNLRTSAAALSRILGWLAYQAEQNGSTPEDFLNAVTQQSLNYCGAFSARAARE
jgi:hypothetical protein